MSLNKEKNSYIYIFTFITVVVVAGILSIVSMTLKPIQKANVTSEKMQNILEATGIKELENINRSEAKDLFYKYVTKRASIDYTGKIINTYEASQIVDEKDKKDPFNIDLRKEYSKYVKPIFNKNKGNKEAIMNDLKNNSFIHLPIFICENQGKKYYVLAFSGKGLWDDIWGYIGFESDASTISGVSFDHKGETPGLGSKITETTFKEQFKGKQILDKNNQLVFFKILKPGSELNTHQVDGISGATFTGVGTQEMINRNLSIYYQFFGSNKEL